MISHFSCEDSWLKYILSESSYPNQDELDGLETLAKDLFSILRGKANTLSRCLRKNNEEKIQIFGVVINNMPHLDYEDWIRDLAEDDFDNDDLD